MVWRRNISVCRDMWSSIIFGCFMGWVCLLGWGFRLWVWGRSSVLSRCRWWITVFFDRVRWSFWCSWVIVFVFEVFNSGYSPCSVHACHPSACANDDETSPSYHYSSVFLLSSRSLAHSTKPSFSWWFFSDLSWFWTDWRRDDESTVCSMPVASLVCSSMCRSVSSLATSWSGRCRVSNWRRLSPMNRRGLCGNSCIMIRRLLDRAD